MIVQLTSTPTIDYVPSQNGHAAFLDLKAPDAPTSAFKGFISFRDGLLPPPDLKKGDALSVQGRIDLPRRLFLIVEHQPAYI